MANQHIVGGSIVAVFFNETAAGQVITPGGFINDVTPPTGGAPPTIPYLWQNPVVVQATRSTQYLGTPASLFPVAAVTNPNIPVMWPPRTYIAVTPQTQVLGSPLTITSTPLAVQPFSQTSWPKPRDLPARWGTQPLGRFSPLMDPAASPPFFQTDWPNPKMLPPVRHTQQLGRSIAYLPISVMPGARGVQQSAPITPIRFGTQRQGCPSALMAVNAVTYRIFGTIID